MEAGLLVHYIYLVDSHLIPILLSLYIGKEVFYFDSTIGFT